MLITALNESAKNGRLMGGAGGPAGRGWRQASHNKAKSYCLLMSAADDRVEAEPLPPIYYLNNHI